MEFFFGGGRVAIGLGDVVIMAIVNVVILQ